MCTRWSASIIEGIPALLRTRPGSIGPSPPIPGRVKGEEGDKRVDLSWEPAGVRQDITFIEEERRGSISCTAFERRALSQAYYPDLNVENGKKYIYSVRALRRVVKTEVEGKGSPEVAAVPTDLIPPSSPVGLVAIPLKSGIELTWRKNQDPDLLGYHVYRRIPGEIEFKRLNQSPLTKETYLDAGVESGQEYEYAVTAVDDSIRRNESRYSEEVRVKYLY